ncbi:MAG: BatA domain-containing protein [bacterium]
MFGISFLNSLFLWGLSAAALPLILHLLKRDRATKLPFAAMRFLRTELFQNVRSQRLKQILLLLMRIVAFLLLALAFARPYLNKANSKTFWANQPKAAVILIDNSFSMAYQDHFKQARAKLQELLSDFESGDLVTVLQFSESAEVIGETDNDGTLPNAWPERLHLTNKSTNYVKAVRSAAAILRQSALEDKAIYVVSDFQRSGLAENYFRFKLDPGIQLHLIPVGTKASANVAITEVKIPENKSTYIKKELLVRVKNFGAQKAKVKATLHLNGKKVAQRRLTIPAGQEKIEQFKHLKISGRSNAGYVQIESGQDALTVDNTFYFVVENKRSVDVLAINGEPDSKDSSKDELFFVERAIDLPNTNKYQLVTARPDNLKKVRFEDHRAIILANVKNFKRRDLERLTYYVRGGGGLILAVGDRVNSTIFNQLFQDLAPAALIEKAKGAVTRKNSVIMAEVDYHHPIFRPFAQPGHGDPSTAQFYQYFRVNPLNTETVLARFDDGNPALLERKVGKGKVILLTTTLDSEWNNLPVKPIFLPLLYQTIQYVAAQKSGQKSFLVGQPIPLTRGPWKTTAKSSLFVKTPNGRKIETPEGFFEQTNEPGIYGIYRNGRKQAFARFAVNVDSRESDLSPLEPTELTARIEMAAETNVQTAAMAASDGGGQIEKRQKFWRFIILAVILLLLGETWLANRTYR